MTLGKLFKPKMHKERINTLSDESQDLNFPLSLCMSFSLPLSFTLTHTHTHTFFTHTHTPFFTRPPPIPTHTDEWTGILIRGIWANQTVIRYLLYKQTDIYFHCIQYRGGQKNQWYKPISYLRILKGKSLSDRFFSPLKHEKQCYRIPRQQNQGCRCYDLGLVKGKWTPLRRP